MSDSEFYDWLGKSEDSPGLVIPKNTNFTTEPDEAIRIGDDYLLTGSLIVFSADYFSDGFEDSLINQITSKGWYQTSSNLYLCCSEFEIFSPAEVLKFVNNG